LGNFTDRRLVPYLVNELDSSDEELVVSVLEALGKIGAAEAESAVLSLVQDGRLRVRSAAVKALGLLSIDYPAESSA
jgi:HEAT repeat protein